MNLSTKLKELRILAESGRAPHIVAYHPENQCFEMVAKEETIIKMCECISDLKEALESYAKFGEEQMPSFMDFKNSNAKVLYREVRTFPYAKEVLEKWFVAE